MDPSRPLPESSYGGLGQGLVALSGVLLAIGLIMVSLRVYTAFFVTKLPRLDLWFTLMAFILAVVAEPFLVLACKHGVGQKLALVRPEDLEGAFFYQTIYYGPIIMSTFFSKIATALIILQIQDRTYPKLKWIVYFVLFFNSVMCVIITIASWFQCDPVSDLWRTNPRMNPRCGLSDDIARIATAQGAASAFSDFFLALYPAVIFWHLNMSRRRRIGLCVLFCTGILAGIASTLRTARTSRLLQAEVLVATAEVVTWGHCEAWLIIIVSCIPPLRPLFLQFYRNVTSSLHSFSNRSGSDSSASHTRKAAQPFHKPRSSSGAVSGSSPKDSFTSWTGSSKTKKGLYDIFPTSKAHKVEAVGHCPKQMDRVLDDTIVVDRGFEVQEITRPGHAITRSDESMDLERSRTGSEEAWLEDGSWEDILASEQRRPTWQVRQAGRF
ncbi:Hypothetical protein D9617_13g099130 [Elsinoe fawcettii]|nr:Hypothetical protein D9617_13g099130 [Elsinoe fawcettii]